MSLFRVLKEKTKMMQSILSVNWKNFEAKVVNRILYGLSFPQHLPSLFLASLFHLKTMKPITSNYIRCLMNETLFHLLHLSVAIFPIMHPAAVALVTISIYHRQFLQNAVSVIWVIAPAIWIHLRLAFQVDHLLDSIPLIYRNEDAV